MNSFRFLEHAEASIRRELSTDGRDAAEIKNDLGGLMVMNIYKLATISADKMERIKPIYTAEVLTSGPPRAVRSLPVCRRPCR